MRKSISLAGAILLLTAAVPARADGTTDDPHESPLEFHPKIDAPILTLTAAAWIAGEIAQPYAIPQPPCNPCMASTINPLDRGLAGQHNSIADAVSWGTLGLALAAPLIADGIDVHKNGGGWRAWGTDVGLFAETLSITGALNQGVKLIAQRPRPFVYGLAANDPMFSSSESFVSFFSEHSSMAFAAAAYYTTLFALRHPERKGSAAAVGLFAFGLAAATAALRVEAGKHFYTDVLAGAALGTAVGVAVPMLHRRKIHIPISIAPIPGGAMATFTMIND